MSKGFHTFRAQADSKKRRKGKYLSREYLIVPIVALVEGVIHPSNATAPELALASEFAKVPAGWNGRPVVMNHPQVDGLPVSANSPDILESYAFGFLFNTYRDDTKLKSEAWIDIVRANELGGEFQEVVDRINAEETIEISTGLFTTNLEESGTHNGKKYQEVWREIVPDHLAFLSKGSTGACSVEDGCGAPRMNESLVTSSNRTWTELHTSQVALRTACACDEIKPNEKDEAANEQVRVQRLLANSYPEGMVDRDVFQVLSRAIKEQYSEGYYCSLLMFTQNEAIYVAYSKESWSSCIYAVPYDLTDNTKVTFLGEPREVNLLTKIVPVQESTSRGIKDMTTNANGATAPAVPAVTPAAPNAASPATPVTTAASAAPAPDATPAATPTAPVTPVTPAAQSSTSTTPATQPQTPANNEAQPRQMSQAEYIAAAPPGIREMLEDGMRTQEQRRTELITQLKASNRCDYTDDELKTMRIKDLERLAKLAAVPSYAGQAPANLAAGGTNEDSVPEAPLIFKPATAA